ncbi:MAG: DnaA regulatory inactivator Hda [Gammaproteobacteria bacterium]
MTTSCLHTPTQYSLDIALPKFATFETFIDASGSQLLLVLKELVQKTLPEPQQYFLWGGASTGKTHLLQAICNHQASSNQSAIYLPMKELATQQANILNDMQHIDVLCIDDVDIVLGEKEWDRQLFLLINELRANNKSIVMTASLNPNDAIVSFPDLASRLVWGPVYKLNLLEDDEKIHAIQKHAKARGLDVSTEVCSFLLKRFPRDLNKLIGLLDTLDKESLVQQKKVTVPFVKSVLNLN